MSLSILPVSSPFPTSVVPENQTATDPQHAHDEPNQQRHPHHRVNTPSPEEPVTGSLDPESPRSRGTLIDVQA